MRDLKQKKYATAQININQSIRGPITDLVATLLSGWASYGAGDTKAAVANIDKLAGPEWYPIFKDLHSGMIMELAGKEKEAGNLTISRKAQIDAQTNRVNALMDRAGEMRQDIVQIIMAKQEPKAKQVIAKLQAQGHDTEVIREKLKEMNFEPQLITNLLGEPKRKKFLGLF